MSDQPALLTKILERMQTQQEQAAQELLAEVRKQWADFGEINDRDILIRLCYSSQDTFDTCVAEHPANALRTSVDNVDRAFDILRRSRAAIIDLAGQFHAR